jgi:hypothetical protein
VRVPVGSDTMVAPGQVNGEPAVSYTTYFSETTARVFFCPVDILSVAVVAAGIVDGSATR